MLRKSAMDVCVYPVGRTPLIRRNTNTVLFTLDRDEALTLIKDLSAGFGDGYSDKIVVQIEADDIYAKDME